MLIHLHKKATTTPAIREYIRSCGKPIKTLARELNLNAATVRKWRERDSVQDASHRPHRMQTTLCRSQELLVIELRRTLLLSLDDLTAITRTYIHSHASRAAIGRLLKREGISRLADLIPAEEGEAAPKKTFKDYAPGYLHIDLKELPQMPDEIGNLIFAWPSIAPVAGSISSFCLTRRRRARRAFSIVSRRSARSKSRRY